MSLRKTDQRKWVSVVLFLAALYNVAWGAAAALIPAEMLEWVGVTNLSHPELWQCIGMFVALYGVGYWLASSDPVRYWPFILIGLVGKVMGPIGAIAAVISDRLPSKFLWINLTNDFLWWLPFAWILWVIRRWQASEEPASSLYRTVIGPSFDQLAPHVRHFHSSPNSIQVRGEFRVTRGSTGIGNWLADMAGFPRTQERLQVSLRVDPSASGEIWRRSFAGNVIESHQFKSHALLAERFGPLIIYLEPRVVEDSLEITDVFSTFLGVPLPPFLAPRVFARGTDGDAAIDVLVRLSCTPLGLLVEYQGTVSESTSPVS